MVTDYDKRQVNSYKFDVIAATTVSVTNLPRPRARHRRTVAHQSGACSCCHDCGAEVLSPAPGVRTEWFMVTPAVWHAAGAAKRAVLCVGCLEARLGRRLHRGDFTDCPLNDLNRHQPDKAWWWRTDRLVDRMTAPSPWDGDRVATEDRARAVIGGLTSITIRTTRIPQDAQAARLSPGTLAAGIASRSAAPRRATGQLCEPAPRRTP